MPENAGSDDRTPSESGADLLQLVPRTESFVRERLAGEGTGHDWYHVDRVRRLALEIVLCETEPVDLLVVELAALLHDVADWKFEKGDLQAGPRVILQFLGENGASDQLAGRVARVASEVSFKGAEVPDQPSSLEACIVQDADRLDAIGAIGVARAFAYGGSIGTPLHAPETAPRLHKSFSEYSACRGTTFNHFHEKLLLLKDRMKTARGKELATQRHAFMEQFLDRFLEEWEGGPDRLPCAQPEQEPAHEAG